MNQSHNEMFNKQQQLMGGAYCDPFGRVGGVSYAVPSPRPPHVLAFDRVSHALEGLTDEQKRCVLRAIVALYGVDLINVEEVHP